MKTVWTAIAGGALFAAGFWFGQETTVRAQANRVFELRTYTTLEGRLDALHARFRNHTTKLFTKHGITNVGYWVPMDEPRSKNTLVYLLAHPSREAAKKNFDAFRNDPAWIKARDESEASGKIVEKVESVFLAPVDYSPLK
jgi:hypothetical protein